MPGGEARAWSAAARLLAAAWLVAVIADVLLVSRAADEQKAVAGGVALGVVGVGLLVDLLLRLVRRQQGIAYRLEVVGQLPVARGVSPVGQVAAAGLAVVLAVLVRLDLEGGTASTAPLLAGSACAAFTAPLRSRATTVQRELQAATGGLLLRAADPRWVRRNPGTSGLWMLVTSPELAVAAPVTVAAVEAVPLANLPRSGYGKLPGT